MRALVLVTLLCACGEETTTGVVLFSKTTGYRHQDAIDAALDVLADKLSGAGYSVRATESADEMTDLRDADVVVFLYTTGNDVLDTEGKRELERFVRAGGGWVGIHSAADTEYEWPFYQELVVAHFGSHPDVQSASIDLQNVPHDAIGASVPMRWTAEDEWYNYLRDAGSVAGVTVLANLDETTYEGGDMGAKHPIAWAHQRFVGRAAYSGLGHSGARWEDPIYLDHVITLIEWAATKPAPTE